MTRRCWYCGRVIREHWILLDKDGELSGAYCCRKCAEYDAWGPRFVTFTVRTATPEEME